MADKRKPTKKSSAAKTLSNPKASSAKKSAAGKTLAKAKAQKKARLSQASKTLRNPKASKTAKSAAAKVLSGRTRTVKSPQKLGKINKKSARTAVKSVSSKRKKR